MIISYLKILNVGYLMLGNTLLELFVYRLFNNKGMKIDLTSTVFSRLKPNGTNIR